MIADAPLIFATAIVLLGAAMWFFINHLRAAEIDGLKAQLRLRDDQIADKDRLIWELKPTLTAYMQLGNAGLRSIAEILVVRLREFYKNESAQEIRDKEAEELFSSKEWPRPTLEAGRQQRALRWTSAYNEQFKSESMLLRDEMMSRLPPNIIPGSSIGPSGHKIDLSMYGTITYMWQLEDLANHLESLAKLLPQDSSSDSIQT